MAEMIRHYTVVLSFPLELLFDEAGEDARLPLDSQGFKRIVAENLAADYGLSVHDVLDLADYVDAVVYHDDQDEGV